MEVGGAKAKEQFAEWEEKTKGLYGRVIRQQAASLKEQERNQTATLNRIAKSEEMGVRRKAQWLAQQDRMEQERITTSSRLDAERLSQRQRMEVATARRIESGEREGVRRKAQFQQEQNRLTIQGLRGQEQEAKRMESSITQWRKASMVSRRAIQIQEDKARQSGFGKMKAALAEQEKAMTRTATAQSGMSMGLLKWALGWTVVYGAIRTATSMLQAFVNTAVQADLEARKIVAISGGGAGLAARTQNMLMGIPLAVPLAGLGDAVTVVKELTAAGLDYSQVQQRSIPILQTWLVQGGNLSGLALDLTKSYTILGGRIGTFTQFLDLMNFAANKSATTTGALATALSYMGGVSEETEESGAELVAMLGILSERGIESQRAGTGLRRIIAALSSELGRARLAEAFDIVIDPSKPLKLIPVLEAINKKIGEGKLTAEQLGDMFGIGRERGADLLLVLSKNVDAVKAMAKELDKSVGYTQQMAKLLDESILATAKKIKHEFLTIGAELVASLIPDIDFIFDYIARRINDIPWGKEFEEIAKHRTRARAFEKPGIIETRLANVPRMGEGVPGMVSLPESLKATWAGTAKATDETRANVAAIATVQGWVLDEIEAELKAQKELIDATERELQTRIEILKLVPQITQSLMASDKFTGITDLLTGGATNTAILQMGQFLYQTLSTSIRNAFMEQLVAERISPLIVQAAEAGRLVPTEGGGVQMADPEGFRNAIGAIKDEIKNMKPIIEEADKIIADMGKDLQKTFSVSGKGLREELKEGKVTLEDIGKAQDQIFKKKVKPVIDVQDEASGILDDIIDRISYIKNNEQLNINVTATSAGSIPGAQAGYRATRNQIIQVHRGEEVIPQGFTRRPIESAGGGGTQINVNIPNIPIGTSREEMKEFVRDYLGPTIDDRARRALAPRRATYVRRRGVA